MKVIKKDESKLESSIKEIKNKMRGNRNVEHKNQRSLYINYDFTEFLYNNGNISTHARKHFYCPDLKDDEVMKKDFSYWRSSEYAEKLISLMILTYRKEIMEFMHEETDTLEMSIRWDDVTGYLCKVKREKMYLTKYTGCEL